MTSEIGLIQKTRPVYIEGVFVIIIGMLVVANTTLTDIVFHDSYVLPAISTCYPENQDTFCAEIRQRMGLAPDAQLEIGNIYWNELARQAIFIGVILFTIRLGIAFFLKWMRIRQIRISSILMALFWGFVGAGLFMFGFLDLWYYWFILESPPNELAWLNNAGFFAEAKSWTGDPEIVEVEDMYLLNILGFIVIGTFLFVVMHTYSKSGLSNRGIS